MSAREWWKRRSAALLAPIPTRRRRVKQLEAPVLTKPIASRPKQHRKLKALGLGVCSKCNATAPVFGRRAICRECRRDEMELEP